VIQLMQTRAAVLTVAGGDWQVSDLELDAPRAAEVLVEFAFGGLCHTDEHTRRGNGERLPLIGGHEGAGRVLAVGPGVSRIGAGDHVVALPVPVCGHCRFCADGRASLCVTASRAGTGLLPDGTYRFRSAYGPLGGHCVLGTFAHHSVVSQDSLVVIDRDVPLEVATLISCGVLTGWGAAVHAAQVRPADTVVVFGAGGVGLNAMQGARFSGAAHVIAVDPNEARHELARRLGATDVLVDPAEAAALARRLNPVAEGADRVIVCVGDSSAATTSAAFAATGKAGRVVIASLSHDFEAVNIQLAGTHLVLTERQIIGTLMGSCNPVRDVPRLIELYRSGRIELDALVSRRYRLDDINTGFADLLAGRNARALIDHSA
jgi:NDMA-dependent alcohol dehydrogenase